MAWAAWAYHKDIVQLLISKGVLLDNGPITTMHLGKDHPLTLRNVNGLAVLRTKQKQYEDSERLFHEALEARKLKLG
jgi:hypothetical protein